jgi:hypothetical protein
MRVPVQGAPVLRGGTASLQTAGILPSGTNTQCCGSNCQTAYCFLGLSSKCCIGGNPVICCIGGGSCSCPS